MQTKKFSYIAFDPENFVFKVGQSINPERRIYEAAQCPPCSGQLTLVAKFEGHAIPEDDLIYFFRKHADLVWGDEWFLLSPKNADNNSAFASLLLMLVKNTLADQPRVRIKTSNLMPRDDKFMPSKIK
jgi:hypothetical protein